MKKSRKKSNLFILCLVALLLPFGFTGCSFSEQKGESFESEKEESSLTAEENSDAVSTEEAEILAKEYMEGMTTEEKVGQIFIVNLEQLDRRKGDYYEFQKCTKDMRETIERTHVGGVILFSRNIKDREQTMALTNDLLSADRTPLFIAVDEEGGTVARIASNAQMGTTAFPSAQEIGRTYDADYTYEMAKTIGSEIKELGFNVDFAPVADVKTSQLNEEIGDRSFGSDTDTVSDHVTAFINGLHEENVASAAKHFPGQGSSTGDTHRESVDIDSSIAQLRKVDFVPFKAAIAADTDFIMVSHIGVSKVTETQEPASMSSLIMQTILRDELNFKKIIITDAFDMASIVEEYTPAQAAVNAFNAGADIILMPENFEEAYDEILSEVNDGTIDMDRLDTSVQRILTVKIQRGILTVD